MKFGIIIGDSQTNTPALRGKNEGECLSGESLSYLEHKYMKRLRRMLSKRYGLNG